MNNILTRVILCCPIASFFKNTVIKLDELKYVVCWAFCSFFTSNIIHNTTSNIIHNSTNTTYISDSSTKKTTYISDVCVLHTDKYQTLDISSI